MVEQFTVAVLLIGAIVALLAFRKTNKEENDQPPESEAQEPPVQNASPAPMKAEAVAEITKAAPDIEMRRRKKIIGVTAVAVLVVIALIYGITGFWVVQPIGAIPEGVTVWYFRAGTSLPFIASADGLLLSRHQNVSLLGRGVVIGEVGKFMADRILARFPYSRQLYLISTGGAEFDR